MKVVRGVCSLAYSTYTVHGLIVGVMLYFVDLFFVTFFSLS